MNGVDILMKRTLFWFFSSKQSTNQPPGHIGFLVHFFKNFFFEFWSNFRRWASGYPKPNSPLDQFIYMKVDLEKRRATGLAHSVGSLERYVACMLPAKNLFEAENQRLLKISEDSLPMSHPTLEKRHHNFNHQRTRRSAGPMEFDVGVDEHQRTRRVRRRRKQPSTHYLAKKRDHNGEEERYAVDFGESFDKEKKRTRSATSSGKKSSTLALKFNLPVLFLCFSHGISHKISSFHFFPLFVKKIWSFFCWFFTARKVRHQRCRAAFFGLHVSTFSIGGGGGLEILCKTGSLPADLTISYRGGGRGGVGFEKAIFRLT